jgi:hypothetical protein
MPRAGISLFTTRYPESFRIGQRIIRRKDGHYYIVASIQQVVEDGDFVYTIYGYKDPNQGHD